MKVVYLDNAATTCMLPQVIEDMTQVMRELYGNPSSTHSFGRKTKNQIETCRRSIASHFQANTSEIFFTSGATEANNMVIHHAVHTLKVDRIISTQLEHKAVLDTISYQKNIHIDYVPILENGHLDYTHLENLLANNTSKTLVSLMMVNNEIGNILDYKKVASLCKTYQAIFHSDTVQYIGHEIIHFEEAGIDYATCSAHKFHGPKGIGFLYASKKHGMTPYFFGGSQERGFRPGTENMIGIRGLSSSLFLAYQELEKDKQYISSLRQTFIDRLKEVFQTSIIFNGDLENGQYNILNVGFSKSIANDMLLFLLDMHGIAASGGSACSSGSNQGSHVLKAIGKSEDYISIRFSFSKLNNLEDIAYCIEKLKIILLK